MSELIVGTILEPVVYRNYCLLLNWISPFSLNYASRNNYTLILTERSPVLMML